MEIVEAVQEEVVKVVEVTAVKGDKNMKKVKKILLLSSCGALGAGVSGFLTLLVVLINEAVRSVYEPMAFYFAIATIGIQGLCFVPLGASIGLSIVYSSATLQTQKRRLIISSGIGGGLYGVFSFFAEIGSTPGLVLFCISLASSIEKALGSVKKAARVAFVFIGNIFLLWILLRSGDTFFMFVMTVFDPLRSIMARGAYNIIYLMAAFYFLNLTLLVALWDEINI